MKHQIWIAAVLYIAMSAIVHALDIQKLNGHEISIQEVDYVRVLRVDGREMHRNAHILFDEMTTISGVPVVIGSSSNGGNACDSSPFVLSFPVNSKVQFDGPIENCSNISHTVSIDKIKFKTSKVPGSGQQSWEWTPESGFKEIGTVEFKPEDTSGWTALRERSIQNPWDVFDNIEINKQIKKLVVSDFALLQRILTGVGSGEYKGGDYIGHSCTPHSCMSEEAIIFLSQADKKIYIAIKPDEQKIRVYPSVKEWPSKPKNELKAWASKWK